VNGVLFQRLIQIDPLVFFHWLRSRGFFGFGDNLSWFDVSRTGDAAGFVSSIVAAIRATRDMFRR
jgi:hypothetical protein